MKLWTFFSFFLLPCKYFGKAVKLILVVDTNALFVLAFVHGNDLVLVRPVEGFYPETPVGGNLYVNYNVTHNITCSGSGPLGEHTNVAINRYPVVEEVG